MASVPGPSVTPCHSIEKEKENFCRLCQLIMTICSDLFRDILSYYIKPTDLRSTLDKNSQKLQTLKCINSHQLDILYPASGNTQTKVEDMDMCLLYTLLRNVCKIKPHAKKWGNPPNQGDSSLAACIDRIRIMRNSIYGHLKTGSIEDVDFKNYWTDLKTYIVEIEKLLLVGNSYEQKVDKLLSCELSSNAKQYVEEFKQLQMRIDDVERSTKRKIASKKARIDGVARSTKRHIAVKKARVDALEKKQMSTTNDVKEHLQDMEHHMIYVFQGMVTAMEKKMEEKISSLEQKMEGKLTSMEQKMEEKFSKMNKKVEEALQRLMLLPFVILTFTFDTPADEILKLSYVRSGRLWMKENDDAELIQVDTDGNIIAEIESTGPFCVTEDDALLYASYAFENDEDGEYVHYIKRKTSKETVTLFKTEENESVWDICSSHINGHILVLILIGNVSNSIRNRSFFYKITRYNKHGVKIQDIKTDDIKISPYRYNAYITENRNGDIIMSYHWKTVVGMDSLGGSRFTYSNPEEEITRGICTDKYGHILVAFYTCINLLDEDGTFQKKLLINMSGKFFTSLCLDDKQNICVGNNSGIVKVYKYLKDE